MAKTVLDLIVLFAVSFILSLPAFAAPAASRENLYPTADTYSLSLDSGVLFYSGTGAHITAPLYGIKFGYDAPGNAVINSFGTEGSLYYFSSNSDNGRGNTTGYLFRIEEVLPFRPGERLVPFAAVGAGGIYTSDDISTKMLPFLNYGGGLKYFLEKNLALRADFRHILALTIGGTDNFEVTAGLSYYFDKKSTKRPEPLPEVKKSDEEQKAAAKKEQDEKERIAKKQREKELAEQELIAQERRKQEKLNKERLQKEWEEFETKQLGKPADIQKPAIAAVQAEQTAITPLQPPKAPVTAVPAISAPVPPAGVQSPALAAVPAGTAVESAPVIAISSLPAKTPAVPKAEPSAKAKAMPPAKTAATPASAGVMAIPAPAGEIAPVTAATPLATVQTAPPVAAAATKVLAGQVTKPPVEQDQPRTADPKQERIVKEQVIEAVPAGTAVESAPVIAISSLPAKPPAVPKAEPSAKAKAMPPAKTAATPAPAGVMAIPAPAGEIAPVTAATPPAPVQTAPPVAAAATKALAGQVTKPPVEQEKRSIAEPEKERIVKELIIEFDFDKSVVKRIYQPQIKQIADFLKSNPGYSVIIEGHTDSIGSSNYNLKLSQRRSNSVKNALIRFGVAAKRVSTKGYGLTRPVADNLTREGRKKNRRAVMITIVTSELRTGSK